MAGRASDRIAEEQAALRRVATLVARAAAPEEVFAAVAEEAGRLLGAEITALTRYDAGPTATTIAPWSSSSDARLHAVGTPVALGGRNAPTVVFETGRPARLDVAGTTGRAADAA